MNLNNQLKNWICKSREEIEVILGDLSSQAAVHTSELAADQKIMTTLDFIFANAYSGTGSFRTVHFLGSLCRYQGMSTRVVHILQHADADSLCLFDELGAGTDPTEGAALAIAI